MAVLLACMYVQSPPSGRLPKFGDTFALNPMFTFFAVQTQLHFFTVASYENNFPPNVGLRPDGGLCTYIHTVPISGSGTLLCFGITSITN